jgi:hypothetical protein
MGQTLTASEWSHDLGIPHNTILMRRARGWTDEECLTTPVQTGCPIYRGKQTSYDDLEKVAGVSRKLISSRICYGWTVERAVETPVSEQSEKTRYLVYILRAADGTEYVGIAYHDGQSPEEGLNQRYRGKDRLHTTRSNRKGKRWRIDRGGFEKLEKIIVGSNMTLAEAKRLEEVMIQTKARGTPLSNTQHMPPNAAPIDVPS